MSNLTFEEIVDDDVFSDFAANVTTSVSEETSLYHPHLLMTVITVTTEIIKFLTCLGTIGACIFLIVVILKYERLKTKTNIFFLHYAIACLIDMLFFPVFALINEFVHYRLYILRCITYTGGTVTCVLIFVFAIAVMLYWFLQTFKTNWIQNVHFQFYFTVALYLFCFIKFIVCISECFTVIYLVSNQLLVFAFYIVTLVMTIIINIITYKNGLNDAQRRTSYQLVVSTFIILSYLPLFLCYLFIALFRRFIFYSSLEYIFMFIYFPSEILAYGGPIVVVFLLGKKNKYFKAAYNKAFKKSVRGYDEDDSGEDSHHEQGQVEDSNEVSPNGIINNPAYALGV